jgi:hypothetical protein
MIVSHSNRRKTKGRDPNDWFAIEQPTSRGYNDRHISAQGWGIEHENKGMKGCPKSEVGTKDKKTTKALDKVLKKALPNAPSRSSCQLPAVHIRRQGQKDDKST